MDFMHLLGRWRAGDDGAYRSLCALTIRAIIGKWRRMTPLPESVDVQDYAQDIAHKLLMIFRSTRWAPGQHGQRSVISYITTAAFTAHATAWREENRQPEAPPLPQRRSKKKGADGGSGEQEDAELRSMENLPVPRRPDADFAGIGRAHIFDALYSLPAKDQEVLFVCGVGCVPDGTYARLAGTTPRNVSVWFSRSAKRLLSKLDVTEADGVWLREFLSGAVAITEGQIAGVADSAHRKLLMRLYAAPDPERRARSLALWRREVDNPKRAQRLLWAALVSLMKTRRVLKGDPRKAVRAAMGLLLGPRVKRRR